MEEEAANLQRLARRMNLGGHRPPFALAVILPNGYGYVRGGEVGTIPIGALGPQQAVDNPRGATQSGAQEP